MAKHKERKDYCGPYWMPSFMRKWFSNKFNASCKVHDLDYKSKAYSRAEADARFLDHMLRQAKGQMFWEAIAVFFYIAVRLGGQISWDSDSEG